MSNPLTYGDYTYTWENGRQLSSVSINGTDATYKYNANGFRTQKTVTKNGVSTVTDYVVDHNGRILQEKTGSDITVFEYDSNGQLVSMKYNGAVYYYLFNLQGDVVGLLNSSGNVAMTYAWDAWGNNIITFGMSESGEANPFGYRGYYWDRETGFYYLNSRYYSAEWGRFLNADAQINDGVLGTNLFAYCENNPIMRYDPTGEYFRPAAIQYAKKWWNSRNPQFTYDIKANDCANFVSQCLYAGLWRFMNLKWHYYSVKLIFKWVKIDVSNAWGKASGLYSYISSFRYTKYVLKTLQSIKNVTKNISEGDVVFFVTSSGSIYHAALVGRIVSNSDVFYFAHTSNRNGYDTSYGNYLGSFKKFLNSGAGQYIIVIRMI